jgi:hypothetical protein
MQARTGCPLLGLLLAAALLAGAAEGTLRHSEDYRISLYGELAGLSVSPTSASTVDGIPPAGVVTRRVSTHDFLGVDHRLSYSAESSDDVVVLEHHEGVLGLDCGTPGELAIRVEDAEAFLAHLPADPDTVLFVLGAGWGCRSALWKSDNSSDTGPLGQSLNNNTSADAEGTSSTANNTIFVDEEEGELVSLIAATEPDGETMYFRSAGLLPSNDPRVLVFEVGVTSITDVFQSADISYTRVMDKDEEARRYAAAAEFSKQEAQTFAHAGVQNASATTEMQQQQQFEKDGRRRRLSLSEIFEATRFPDDHPEANFVPGLTPHKRAARRLQFVTSYAGTEDYSGLNLPYSYDKVNGAHASYTPCITWGFLDNNCVWGLNNGQFRYDFVNWNYDVNKANACRQASQNPEQCSRAKIASISLLSTVVTCRSCYLYLGGDLSFILLFNKAVIHDFKLAVSAAASAALDIQVVFPNQAYNYGPQTTSILSRTTIAVVPIPLYVVTLTIRVSITLDVELSGSASTYGRIVGPGFWFDASVTAGAQYRLGTWKDLTTTSLYMNQRAPVLDITITASVQAKLIIGLEFNLNILGELHRRQKEQLNRAQHVLHME